MDAQQEKRRGSLLRLAAMYRDHPTILVAHGFLLLVAIVIVGWLFPIVRIYDN